MKTYLSEEKIITLIDMCNTTLSTDNKKELKRIGKIFNVELNQDEKTNSNLIFHAAIPMLWDSRLTSNYKQMDYDANFGNYCSNVIDFIYKYWQQEYEFVFYLKLDKLRSDVNSIVGEVDNDINYFIPDLFAIDNYEKHFQQYDKRHCDKTAITETNQILSAINTTYGVRHSINRQYLINVIQHYLNNEESGRYYDAEENVNFLHNAIQKLNTI